MHSKSMMGEAITRLWTIVTLSMLLINLAMGQPAQYKRNLVDTDLNKARTLIDKNEVDSALFYLNRYLAKNATDQKALFFRARIFSNLGYLEKAHGDYNSLVALNPLHKEAVYSRGIVRYQLMQYENALVDFQNALKLPIGETQTAFFKMEGGAATGIATLNGMEAEIWNNIGLCHYQMQQYNKAIQAYNQGMDLNQKNPDLYVNRALAWEKQGKTQAAIQDYEHALAINPDHPIASYNLIHLNKAPKNHELHELDVFISNNPKFAPGYTSRGLYYYNSGKYGLAAKDLKTAVELDPENVTYLFNLALCRGKLKNTSTAESLFLRIVEIDPGHAGAYFNLGNIQYKQRAYEEAISYFTLAHHANPENMDVLYNRALAYQQNGKLDLACIDMEKVQKAGYPPADSFIKKYCIVEP